MIGFCRDCFCYPARGGGWDDRLCKTKVQLDNCIKGGKGDGA